MTGNDVIGYFRSATNSVNATGAIANPWRQEIFVREYFAICYSKQIQNFTSRCPQQPNYFQSAANRISYIRVDSFFLPWLDLCGDTYRMKLNNFLVKQHSKTVKEVK